MTVMKNWQVKKLEEEEAMIDWLRRNRYLLEERKKWEKEQDLQDWWWEKRRWEGRV